MLDLKHDLAFSNLSGTIAEIDVARVAETLDFNEMLVQNPAATFAVRISGQSMTGAGLFPGDVAVVDRSLTPVNGSIVLALIGDEDSEFSGHFDVTVVNPVI